MPTIPWSSATIEGEFGQLIPCEDVFYGRRPAQAKMLKDDEKYRIWVEYREPIEIEINPQKKITWADVVLVAVTIQALALLWMRL